MVYIPLVICCTKSQLDKQRVHLLGIVMVWTFAPLIPGENGVALKNLMLAAQIFWLPICLNSIVQLIDNSWKLTAYKKLTTLTIGVIIVL